VDAEKEVRQGLAIEPNSSMLHAWLAVCLLPQKRLFEAHVAARAAIAADPESGFAHYTAARVAHRRDDESGAMTAIFEALRLEPTDADYHYLQAAIDYDHGRWRQALRGAEEGLKHQPNHVLCANLRALCLSTFGNDAEAASTIDRALAENPEYYWSHQNRGMLALNAGEVEKAFGHYREALRLNPQSAAARDGLVQSLKSRRIMYRALFGLFDISDQRHHKRRLLLCLVVIGALSFALDVLTAPKQALLIAGVLTVVGYFVANRLFVLYAEPFFLFLLRFDALGRRALSAEEVRRANLALGSLVTAGGLLAAALVFRMPLFGVLAVLAILSPLPLGFIFRQPPGLLRFWAALDYTVLSIVAFLLLGVALAIPFAGAVWMWSGVAAYYGAMLRRAQARLRDVDE